MLNVLNQDVFSTGGGVGLQAELELSLSAGW